MRCCGHAALATSFGGAPYASLVLLAADLDASPLLLLSDLARHSRNIAFDPRVSLLLDASEEYADRLDGPRLSLLGQAEAVSDRQLLARFTARHPTSAAYAGFADFRLYRIAVVRGHLVAGFGRIEWIAGAELRFAGEISGFVATEPAVRAELNDHPDVIDRCARTLGRGESNWQITGLDPEGADLRCAGGTARLDFATPALTPQAAQTALLRLAGIAHK
jgi:putative heme iron utilization protein